MLATVAVGSAAVPTAGAVEGDVSGPAPASDLAVGRRIACERADPPAPPPDPEISGLRAFSDDEFQRLVDLTGPSAIVTTGDPPSILGDAVADARIRSIAEARGYRRRPDVGTSGLAYVAGGLLTPTTATAWFQMTATARSEGVTLTLASAYRSTARQRSIFASKLAGRGHGVASVRSGRADGQIVSILRFSSIPGYSRHHTGATVDVVSPGFTLGSFHHSAGYRWLSANNFENAKRHGFVPSYPGAAGLQGPDPEPWEFVHVGLDAVSESPAAARLGPFSVASGTVQVDGDPADPNDVFDLYGDDRPIATAAATCMEGLPAGSFRLQAPVGDVQDLCVVQRSATGPDRLLGCWT